MKKCLAIAVLLLASSLTAAQAQFTFEYGGRTITIDPDRGTVSIPGVYDNTGKKAKRPRSEEGDLDRPRRKTPQQAKTAPQAAPETAPLAPAPAEQATAPAAPAPAAPAPAAPATASRRTPSTATAAVAPLICAGTARYPSSRSGYAAGARSRCRAGATAATTETGRGPGNFGTFAPRIHRSACG